MKKIIKIITFYEDGTFSESTPSAPFSPMPSTPLTPPYPWPEIKESVKVCTKCGLKLDGPMGYVCSNYPCPCGLGGAWCAS